MIYYAIAYLVGILWLHVRLMALFVFILLLFIAIRKQLKLIQFISIVILPILSFMVFQNDLVHTRDQRTMQYNNTHLQSQAYFLTKPVLKHQKLRGKVEINHQIFTFYYYLKHGTKDNIENKLFQKSCYVRGELSSINNRFNDKATLFVKAIDLSSCKSNESGHQYLLERHRAYIFDKLKATHIKGPEKIIALISGDTTNIDVNDLEKYKEIGIYHLLAISGTHVAIIIGIIFYVLNLFRMPLFFIKFVILLLLPLYVLYTELAPSAMRAVIVTIIVIVLPKRIFRNTMNILAFSFITLTLISPSLIYHIGFQFSFMITFFILLSLPLLEKLTAFKSTFYITFIAQLGSLIISAHYFNQIQWIGFISNLFFVPFYVFILYPLTLIYFIINHLPIEIQLLTGLLNLVIKIHDIIVDIFYSLSWHKWYIPELNEYFLVIALAMILAALVALVHKKFKILTGLMILIYIIVTVLPSANDYRLTMLNVGQGDAILFETNKQHTLLIDTGGKLLEKGEKATHNIARYHILPTLKKRAIKTINYLIITHPHQDHIGELNYLIEKYRIENIILNSASMKSEQLNSLKKQCRNNEIPLYDFREKQNFKLDKAVINLLDVTINASDDLNEHSIVTLITYEKYKMLLMGDATKNNENELLKQFNLKAVDVLKIGHHGSKTSTSEAFIRTITPKISLISVAHKNRYNLPNQETINRLISYHSQVYQTANHGEVTIDFKENMYIKTERK
ncbi:DNA internalization-related competence protein ComEC/Rec2 [Staphylococcus succinus]|uniref:DNA internalization-related competence protein ComEC/Rec2 n=1 Tax=Staphylococcus succinus TaxID=61015 RepID=UPI003F5428E2